MAATLVDNDVVIKISAYGLESSMLGLMNAADAPPAMLSVGRFVVLDRLGRSGRISNKVAARAHFAELLSRMELLEPTSSEITAAAAYESLANKANLELDSGESQLLAICIQRAARILLTGDKRAVKAIAIIAPEGAVEKLACFEQLMAALVSIVGHEGVKAAVCNEAP